MTTLMTGAAVFLLALSAMLLHLAVRSLQERVRRLEISLVEFTDALGRMDCLLHNPEMLEKAQAERERSYRYEMARAQGMKNAYTTFGDYLARRQSDDAS